MLERAYPYNDHGGDIASHQELRSLGTYPSAGRTEASATRTTVANIDAWFLKTLLAMVNRCLTADDVDDACHDTGSSFFDYFFFQNDGAP